MEKVPSLSNNMVNPAAADIFCLPIGNKYLLYAPLHQLTALIDARAARQMRANLCHATGVSPILDEVVRRLYQPVLAPPTNNRGPLAEPLFLGIIPTRGCNMACRYCDFVMPKQSSPIMDLDLARASVDAYLGLLHKSGRKKASIQFFGGEPFYAPDIVHFLVTYAQSLANQLGITTYFEVLTNGLFNTRLCAWIADTFDTVVLSLDGPGDIQDSHRPGITGMSVSDVIQRNARILSHGSAELMLRACVTSATVSRLPEIAEWFRQEFLPAGVCFEVLSPGVLARQAGLIPPDPWEFGQAFDTAAQLLALHGIDTLLSTADTQNMFASFCPVGKDALIVSPDGAIDSCYLLQKEWESKGLDLRIGQVDKTGILPQDILKIDQEKLEQVRALDVYHKPLCRDCFCRYHCAGGCHINHNTSAPPGHFDNLCILTRLVTAAKLLRQIGQDDSVTAWFADRVGLETTILQPSDRLADQDWH